MGDLKAISKSRYGTFQDNPFHYFLQYERSLGLNPNNPYLRRGSLVHEALEHVWKFVDEDSIPSEQDLWVALQRCASEVDFEQYDEYDRDEYFSPEHIDEFEKFFKNWIDIQLGLYEEHGLNAYPEKLEYAMWDKDAEMRGIADAVLKFSDGWYIIDYKTGSITQNKLSKYYMEELAFYQHLWETITGEEVAGVGIMGLKNGKLCIDTCRPDEVQKVVDKSQHYLKMIRNDQFPINYNDDHYFTDYDDICPFAGYRSSNKEGRWRYLDRFGVIAGDPYENEVEEWNNQEYIGVGHE